jgi:integrase
MKQNETQRRMQRGEFRIVELKKPIGKCHFRVYGWKLDAKEIDDGRVRENFKTHGEALTRKQELEIQSANVETAVHKVVTRLTPEQAAVAESAFLRLGPDAIDQLLPAVDYWMKLGKQNALKESPLIHKAVTDFTQWLEETPTLRGRTKANLRLRVGAFGNNIGSVRVADITRSVVESYLEKRNVSPASRDNDRRAVSRFFSWCMKNKREWTATNPCHGVEVEQAEDNAPPKVLSLAQCEKLLRAAEAYRNGRLVPYVAVCLFGGLRPFEAARLDWHHVNLADREIRLEGTMTKTKRGRVISIDDTLAAWLQAKKDKPFYPVNWRKDFDTIKASAGFGNPDRLNQSQREAAGQLEPWPDDVMRHTAISHYFRQTGSYGQTAEQFGNSEAIIKKHYQGRVNSEDTKAFYALLPTVPKAYHSRKIITLATQPRKASKVQAVGVRA